MKKWVPCYVPLYSRLLLVPLLVGGVRAFAQSSSENIPWVGAKGVTETVNDIMARERARGGYGPFTGYQVKPEPGERLEKLPLAGAPAVSRWPSADQTGNVVAPLLEGDNPQTVGVTFLGTQIADGPGFVPPDCMGDVGPTQVLVAANGRIRVYDKTGALGALDADMDVFFSSVRNGSGTSDPHIRYDRISQRWFVIIINVASTNNRVLLAVSSGSTITGSGSFTFYFFQHNLVSPAGDNNRFADYPTLGIDANALYIGTNNFTTTSFASCTGFVVRKSSVLSGGPIVVTAFRNIHDDGSSRGLFTPQGVDNDDASATEGYFVGVDAFVFSLLEIRRVSDPGGTPSISGNLSVSVPTTVFPRSVPASGTSTSLDALDDRLFAAQLKRNNNTGVTTLWTAHNIEVDASGVGTTGGGRDGGRWYEIGSLATTPALIQSGTLFDPAVTTPRFFWIPSVAMSGQGHVALVSSIAGSGRRAEIAASGRLAGDVLGTTQGFITAQTSSTAYNITVTNPQRWGDFSQTVVDPTDDMTMWTFQEYCNATNSWGVRVIQIIAPPPVTPTVATPNSVRQGDVGVNVVISGPSVSGSGFFDPGSGFSRRISASVSGTGVTVNSIAYADPTHVTLNLTVSGSAPIGDRTITITNPDGQSATSATNPAILAVDAPLPIQLASFTGTFRSPNTVRLDWTTVSEVNNFGFEIERSAYLLSGFVTISGSFTPGHGTTNQVHFYNYVDGSPGGSIVYYKLKQIDLDGTVNRSDPIVVSTATSVAIPEVPEQFSLAQNYPNPFNPSTVIKYGLPVSSEVKLEVFDMLGQRVSLLVNQKEEAGYHEAVFDNTSLSSGVYLYSIQAGQFRASKKFLLLR